MTKKIIIGFVGLMASGKGEAAQYLQEKYGAVSFRFSSMLRDALKRFHVPETRDNLVKMSELIRASFGENILAKTMAEDIKMSPQSMIVVDGIRRIADIEFLRLLPEFVMVAVVADPRIRYERLTQRQENSDDQTKTYEQFLLDQEKSTEVTIPPVMRLAQREVTNNDSREEFYLQLDELVARLK